MLYCFLAWIRRHCSACLAAPGALLSSLADHVQIPTTQSYTVCDPLDPSLPNPREVRNRRVHAHRASQGPVASQTKDQRHTQAMALTMQNMSNGTTNLLPASNHSPNVRAVSCSGV